MSGQRLSPTEWTVVGRLLDDAWAYRLGEAAGLEDPDLEPEDRQVLLEYEAFGVALGLINPDD